jgi:hypothetical protein
MRATLTTRIAPSMSAPLATGIAPIPILAVHSPTPISPQGQDLHHAKGPRSRHRRLPPAPTCLQDLTPQQQLGVPFVEQFYGNAVTLATKGGIPQDWILAWSGDESSWGTSPIARRQKNYFGWHGGGNVKCGGGSNPVVGCFSDYLASGLTALFSTNNYFHYNGAVGVSSDTILLSQYSMGASAAQAFQALANAGYNGNPSYGTVISKWLGDVDAIETCLMPLGLLP